MKPGDLPSWLQDPRRPALVMGVLNVTPDSFSDGGRFSAIDVALDHARQMVDDGADWIDVGAESTRPGSQRTGADDQLRRLLPLFAKLRDQARVVLSIDTTLAVVAQAALDGGFDVVNDISGGRDDPRLLPLVAERQVPVILMHMLGEPATMQTAPAYQDVTAEVCEFLANRSVAAQAAGVAAQNILLDPGIGFGKTDTHNLQLLRDLRVFARDGSPLVIGTSRKGFIGRTTGEPAESGRCFGTAATVAWSVANGAAVVRVHDVGPMSQVVRMIRAIKIVTP